MEPSLRQGIVKTFLQHSLLVSEDFVACIPDDFDADSFIKTLRGRELFNDLVFVDNNIKQLIEGEKELNWKEAELVRAHTEKKSDNTFSRIISEMAAEGKNKKDASSEVHPCVKVLYEQQICGKKHDVIDFVNYFKMRFEYLKKMLYTRPDMAALLSISKVLAKKERENISIIGMVADKSVSKNRNIILKLEDLTGQIDVVISQSKKEVYNLAKSLVFDEVIGVNGTNSNNLVFADKIILPEISFDKELKKSPNEEYAVFLSDIHTGSKNFLEEKFRKFIKWVNCSLNTGSEIASKVKYLFIIGDLVDGVGVYPGQEHELAIKDIYEQYRVFSEFIKQIPQYINVIICAGNHDAVRISEPQPKIPEEYLGEIAALPNIVLVTNPAYVNIASSNGFPGFDVLIYHGYSFDYYIANIDEIRNKGGYDRADLVMKFLLQKRHLAPTHSSSLYIPLENDPLLIKTCPDFFVTGHIHKTCVSSYNNITLISGSCWQSTTAFQEKVGHHPEPARVPLVNLKTRDIKILKF